MSAKSEKIVSLEEGFPQVPVGIDNCHRHPEASDHMRTCSYQPFILGATIGAYKMNSDTSRCLAVQCLWEQCILLMRNQLRSITSGGICAYNKHWWLRTQSILCGRAGAWSQWPSWSLPTPICCQLSKAKGSPVFNKNVKNGLYRERIGNVGSREGKLFMNELICSHSALQLFGWDSEFWGAIVDPFLLLPFSS